jgi:hypothetical protein
VIKLANEQNLVPFSERTEKEQREIQRMGGIKSGEVRRARKSFKESFVNELSQGKNQDEIVKSILEKARQGDIQSAIFIRDTIGEKPTDKVEQSGESKLIVKLEGDAAEWGK